MKITDYDQIKQQILQEYYAQDWTLKEFLNKQKIITLVLFIYATANEGKAQAFDCIVSDELKLSFIWTGTKLTLILGDAAARVQVEAICIFDNLVEDINSIFTLIQLCFTKLGF